MPKGMLPIVDKPLVQYGLEKPLETSISNIGVISGGGKRAIKDHIDVSYELENIIAGSSQGALLDDISRIINTCSFSDTHPDGKTLQRIPVHYRRHRGCPRR
jgi:UTP--glucose-1-phosphate uridylyltransferase